MILGSQDDFDQLAELHPNSGTYRLLSRREHPELTSMSGGFSMIEGTMLSLYRRDDVLFFRVGGREFELTDDVTSTLTQEDTGRVFQLIRNGKSLVSFKYRPPAPEVPLNIDPTPFVEEEDFNFFLFVHEVLSTSGRRHRVYNQ